MELFGGGSQNISNLSNLLNESRISQERIAESKNQPPSVTSPTNIVLPAANKTSKDSKQNKSSDIWSPEEIPGEDAITDNSDTRPTPRYEINYQQSVGAEDTFLGLSDKTPLSSDCTHLVVKVHFPGCTLKDLDLDVTKNRIKVSSKTLKLFTYLPVDVHEAKGSAKFDKSKEVLTVTLPIDQGM